MPNLTLYHASPSRSSVTLWMLEEVGEPYEVKLLDLQKGDNREPAFLAVNPMGKVPTLRHKDAVITESAAICCYLADRFPKASLAPAIDDPRRGAYLKWLFFGPSCVEPAMIDRTLKREGADKRMLGWGDYDSVIAVLSAAAKAAKPYLLGDEFTAADVVIGSVLRWGMMFKGIPDLPEFKDYVGRLVERPAAKRADAKDAEFGERKAG